MKRSRSSSTRLMNCVLPIRRLLIIENGCLSLSTSLPNNANSMSARLKTQPTLACIYIALRYRGCMHVCVCAHKYRKRESLYLTYILYIYIFSINKLETTIIINNIIHLQRDALRTRPIPSRSHSPAGSRSRTLCRRVEGGAQSTK